MRCRETCIDIKRTAHDKQAFSLCHYAATGSNCRADSDECPFESLEIMCTIFPKDSTISKSKVISFLRYKSSIFGAKKKIQSRITKGTVRELYDSQTVITFMCTHIWMKPLKLACTDRKLM